MNVKRLEALIDDPSELISLGHVFAENGAYWVTQDVLSGLIKVDVANLAAKCAKIGRIENGAMQLNLSESQR